MSLAFPSSSTNMRFNPHLSLVFFLVLFNNAFAEVNCAELQNCQSVLSEKERARSAAAEGKEIWRAYWLSYQASKGDPVYLFTPDGIIFNLFTGEVKTVYEQNKATKLHIERLKSDMKTLEDIVFWYNQHGILTFRQYACSWDCSGHQSGYNLANDRQISSHSECDELEKSEFKEGCYAYVSEKRGEVLRRSTSK